MPIGGRYQETGGGVAGVVATPRGVPTGANGESPGQLWSRGPVDRRLVGLTATEVAGAGYYRAEISAIAGAQVLVERVTVKVPTDVTTAIDLMCGDLVVDETNGAGFQVWEYSPGIFCPMGDPFRIATEVPAGITVQYQVVT